MTETSFIWTECYQIYLKLNLRPKSSRFETPYFIVEPITKSWSKILPKLKNLLTDLQFHYEKLLLFHLRRYSVRRFKKLNSQSTWKGLSTVYVNSAKCVRKDCANASSRYQLLMVRSEIYELLTGEAQTLKIIQT